MLSFKHRSTQHTLNGHSHLVDGRVGVDLADVCPVVILPDRCDVEMESPCLLKLWRWGPRWSEGDWLSR